MFDPWRLVAELAGWTILWQPIKTRGLTSWRDRTIILDPALTGAETRAVLAHELVHARRGPTLKRLLAREEQLVRREAAVLLIDIVHLGDAAAWSRHALAIAVELDVDEDTVLARAETLTPAERALIDARLETLHLP